MNEVIKKCVEEFSQENPRLDYIRGMLDTLLSMNGVEVVPVTKEIIQGQPLDEAAILDAKARTAIAAVMSLNPEQE